MKKLIINTNNYLKKAHYNEKRSEYRWKNAKRRKQFWGASKSIEDRRADGDDGEYRETTRDSDNGEFVDEFVFELDKEVIKARNAEIVRMFNEIVNELDETGKAIVEALKRDYRTAVAAKIAYTNRPHVDRVKKLLRVKLVPVYALWKKRFI